MDIVVLMVHVPLHCFSCACWLQTFFLFTVVIHDVHVWHCCLEFILLLYVQISCVAYPYVLLVQ
jgi:hypothetical protein